LAEGIKSSAGLLDVSGYRDFLKLRGLLAADAIPGLERFDIADFAEIAHSIQLSVLDGVEAFDLKCPIGFHRPLEPHFPIGQTFVLESMVEVSGVGRKGLILAVRAQKRTIP